MNIEIAPKSTETYLTWEEAILYCQFLNYDGGGWRLPTLEELKWMYENKTDEMDYEEGWGYYWSSTKDLGIKSWCFHFNGGFQFDNCNTERNYVRAVGDKI